MKGFMLKIGFTGTQEGMSEFQKQELKRHLIKRSWGWVEFHHGGCVGVDAEAHEIARSLRLVIHRHPACGVDPEKKAYLRGGIVHPAKPPLERNQDIASCDILFAAPLGKEILRSGTWSTVRYARKKDRDIIILKRRPS